MTQKPNRRPPGAVCKLEHKELLGAAMAGVARRLEHIFAPKSRSQYGAVDDWNTDIYGAIGEVAVQQVPRQSRLKQSTP